jgi:hypothetical protein
LSYDPKCSSCGEPATRHYSNYPACLRSVADVARRETLLEVTQLAARSVIRSASAPDMHVKGQEEQRDWIASELESLAMEMS